MVLPIPSYSEIIDLIKKGATIEAQEKIMELREAVLALQQENLALKKDLNEVKEALSRKIELWFDGAVYWDGSEKKDGPYCQPCYDTKRTLVRLHETTGFSNRPAWWCYSCHTEFDKK
jgi:hypothetical protein